MVELRRLVSADGEVATPWALLNFTYLPSRLVSRPRLIGWAFSLNISQGAAVASDSILRLLSQLGKCARLGGNASR